MSMILPWDHKCRGLAAIDRVNAKREVRFVIRDTGDSMVPRSYLVKAWGLLLLNVCVCLEKPGDSIFLCSSGEGF